MPTHAEKRVVPYSPVQLFELVADVGRYPEFLPWCVGSDVKEQSDVHLVADLTIGFKVFRETFTSRVALDRPGAVHVAYEDGPFRYLNNHWKFLPHERGALVDFYVDFEFRSKILQMAIGVVFNEATRLMVNSFLRRARSVYGAPAAQRPVPGAPGTLQPG